MEFSWIRIVLQHLYKLNTNKLALPPSRGGYSLDKMIAVAFTAVCQERLFMVIHTLLNDILFSWRLDRANATTCGQKSLYVFSPYMCVTNQL